MNKNSLAVFEDYKIRRVYDEGSETVTKCNRLKMIAEDGKMYWQEARHLFVERHGG